MTKTITPSTGTGPTSTRKILNPITIIVALAVVVLLATAVVWYRYTLNSRYVFWSAVRNNLSTTAFTRHTTQQSGVQTNDQVSETQTEPKQLVHSTTKIIYGGGQDVTVETENLGTPTADYVRYTKIDTPQKSASGKPLDFSKILNVWGKTAQPADGQTTGQQYNESVLSVIPFGKLKPADRAKLIKDMDDKKVYTYSIQSTTKKGLLQRPEHVVKVQVNTVAYIGILKEYAHMVGLNQLEQVDAGQYSSSQPVTVLLTIDGWSHQIRKIDYGQGARVELISGYNNARPAPALPTNTVSVDELQSRLQSVQ